MTVDMAQNKTMKFWVFPDPGTFLLIEEVLALQLKCKRWSGGAQYVCV